jgi:hypothetical protein
MTTPDSQVEAMRGLCEKLKAHPAIKDAYVDDWGRHGNFQLCVRPNNLDDLHFTKRLIAAIKANLPKGPQLREVFPPDRIRGRYDTPVTPRSQQLSRTFWVVDVDYHEYNPETNRFACQA